MAAQAKHFKKPTEYRVPRKLCQGAERAHTHRVCVCWPGWLGGFMGFRGSAGW